MVRHKIYTGIAVLAAIVLISGASILTVASPATTSDPLVSLSYLTGPFRTAVNNHVASQVSALTNTFNTRASQVETQVASALSSNQAQVFVLFTLNNGQTRDLPAGAEVMLRGGSASISSGRMTNSTAGTEQTSGGLTVNNMYLVTEAGRITATAANTTLLIRGG